jgi:EmrB/QacA subfamily drug resistance transporter
MRAGSSVPRSPPSGGGRPTTEPRLNHRTATSRRTRSPWVALAVLLVGTFASLLNASVLGVVLPTIAADLGSGGGGLEVDWAVTSFLVGVVLTQPAAAWCADRWGHVAVFVASLTVFGAGAVVCFSAPNIETLVAGRFVQGLGGGALMPIGMAMVYELFPADRRGTALGIWGIGAMAAPAAGPPLGGWLATAAGWRWFFGISAAVALVAVVLAWALLPESRARARRRLDGVGWAIASAAVVAAVLTSRQAATWGVTSSTTIVATCLTGSLMALLVHHCLRKDEPIIELGMFGFPGFSVTMVVAAVVHIATFARVSYLPVELQVIHGLDAQHAGLLLTPGAVAVAAAMPVAGWLTDHHGARLPVIVGMTLNAGSMWLLAHMQSVDSDARVAAVLILQGIGTGLAFVPTTVAAIDSVPRRFVSQASSVTNLNRQLAAAIGVAMLGAMVVSDLGAIAPAAPALGGAQAAYNQVFLVVFWLTVVGLVASCLMPRRPRVSAHDLPRNPGDPAASIQGGP